MENLSGLNVYRVGDSIFIPLPKTLWRESGFPGKCTCGKCDGSGMWDTLAIAQNPEIHKDWTRTVHFPELQGGGLGAREAAQHAEEILRKRRFSQGV